MGDLPRTQIYWITGWTCLNFPKPQVKILQRWLLSPPGDFYLCSEVGTIAEPFYELKTDLRVEQHPVKERTVCGHAAWVHICFDGDSDDHCFSSGGARHLQELCFVPAGVRERPIR